MIKFLNEEERAVWDSFVAASLINAKDYSGAVHMADGAILERRVRDGLMEPIRPFSKIADGIQAP